MTAYRQINQDQAAFKEN
jgi:hypothetical protein